MQQELSVTARSVSSTPTPAPDAPMPVGPETIIEPTRGWIGVNWGELFHGRELLYFLIWRDIKVRYKQAVLGAAWAVLQPLFNMILFTLVFGSAAGFSQRLGPDWGQRYALFVFVAMLPWQLFSSALTAGGMSLVAQQNILTKIYFPRLYVPTSVVGGALVDMAISSVFVVGLMAWFHVLPSITALLLPLLLALTLGCALGAAYLFSALTATYRDFRFLVPFIGQVWMWLSFVAFPPGIVGPRWRILLALNPMFGIIAAWRKVLLGGVPDDMIGWNPIYLGTAILLTAALLAAGLLYFRRTERRFADIA